jgi:hypothetical protein
MQGINKLPYQHKVIFMATQNPAIKASPRPVVRSVAKHLQLDDTLVRQGSQGMTTLRFPFGDTGQERFLSEILRYAILAPWMTAALDKGLSGELA